MGKKNDPLTNELHWRKYALNLSPLLADLIDHLIAPTANHRPQNTQVILQKLNEVQKALQTPRILWQQTAIQSTNGSKSAGSSSSVATVSIGRAKSVNASSSQTQKSQKLWQLLIGLGLGCFAVVIAAINQPNTKNPVSVSPVENVPVAIPSPVTQIPEIPLTVKSQRTISPLTLPTSDKVEIQKAQTEEIEKQKLQAALKAKEERQAAIRKEAAVRTAREQLEAVIRERREMRERREQLNTDIRERALITQKRQQADKQQQTKSNLEKAKQVYLQTKEQLKTVTTSNQRQVPPKQQVTTERPENTLDTNNDGGNIPNPWESTYPIPKASDELEKVIREGNQ